MLIGHMIIRMQMLYDTLWKKEAMLSTYLVRGEQKYLVCR